METARILTYPRGFAPRTPLHALSLSLARVAAYCDGGCGIGKGFRGSISSRIAAL